MSKTLSKVLMICAMVVVFPLMIVGTVFASYYSIDATLALDLCTNSVAPLTGSYAKILVNGKEYSEKTTFTYGHLKDVTLVAAAEGYDFVGWFMGNSQDYNAAKLAGDVDYISTKNALTFEMREHDKVTAIFEEREYTLSYNFETTTEDGKAVLNVPTTADQNIVWGSKLPELQSEGYKYKFAGWKIKDGDGTIYTHATFDTKTAELEAVWNEQKKFRISYVNNGIEVDYDEIFEGEPYQTKSLADVMGENSITEENGYTYSWDHAQTTFTNDTTFSIVKTAIEYSVKVNHTAELAANAETATFSLENVEGLKALLAAANWTAKYDFRAYMGVVYNGTTYTAENAQEFVNKVVATYGRGTDNAIEVTAKVDESKYTRVTFSDYNVDGALITGSNGYVYKQGDIGYTPWKNVVKSNSLNATLEEIAGLEGVELYDANNNLVRITGVKIKIDSSKTVSRYEANGTAITKDTKMIDILQELLNNNSTQVRNALLNSDGSYKDVLELVKLDLVFEVVE